MSTPCSITAKCNDGKLRTIYCHYDGHLFSAGQVLFEHFQNQKKIEELIRLGDISSLEPSIECPPGHSFKNPTNGHTVFCMRDRKQKGSSFEAYVGDTLRECIRENFQAFNYFWDGQEWMLVNYYYDDKKVEWIVECKILEKIEEPCDTI